MNFNMTDGKLHKFKICGQEAILINRNVEVSVPDGDVGTKIILKLSNAILDNKIKSLRVHMREKIVFISAKDKDHIVMRAEDVNDKKIMN